MHPETPACTTAAPRKRQVRTTILTWRAPVPAPTRPEIREPDDPAHLGFLQSAYAHIMGRTAYEAIAGSMTTSTDHPFALS